MSGRKLGFRSHSEDGAALQALQLSVFATPDKARISLWRWLEEFLGECAVFGPEAVLVDPQAWLPWGLSGERLASLQVPLARAQDAMTASGPRSGAAPCTDCLRLHRQWQGFPIPRGAHPPGPPE